MALFEILTVAKGSAPRESFWVEEFGGETSNVAAHGNLYVVSEGGVADMALAVRTIREAYYGDPGAASVQETLARLTQSVLAANEVVGARPTIGVSVVAAVATERGELFLTYGGNCQAFVYRRSEAALERVTRREFSRALLDGTRGMRPGEEYRALADGDVVLLLTGAVLDCVTEGELEAIASEAGDLGLDTAAEMILERVSRRDPAARATVVLFGATALEEPEAVVPPPVAPPVVAPPVAAEPTAVSYQREALPSLMAGRGRPAALAMTSADSLPEIEEPGPAFTEYQWAEELESEEADQAPALDAPLAATKSTFAVPAVPEYDETDDAILDGAPWAPELALPAQVAVSPLATPVPAPAWAELERQASLPRQEILSGPPAAAAVPVETAPLNVPPTTVFQVEEPARQAVRDWETADPTPWQPTEVLEAAERANAWTPADEPEPIERWESVPHAAPPRPAGDRAGNGWRLPLMPVLPFPKSKQPPAQAATEFGALERDWSRYPREPGALRRGAGMAVRLVLLAGLGLALAAVVVGAFVLLGTLVPGGLVRQPKVQPQAVRDGDLFTRPFARDLADGVIQTQGTAGSQQLLARVDELWARGDAGDIAVLQEIVALLETARQTAPADAGIAQKLGVARVNLAYRERFAEVNTWWPVGTAVESLAAWARVVESLEALLRLELPAEYRRTTIEKAYAAHVNYGRALDASRRTAEATAHYQRARELDPSRPEAAQALSGR